MIIQSTPHDAGGAGLVDLSSLQAPANPYPVELGEFWCDSTYLQHPTNQTTHQVWIFAALGSLLARSAVGSETLKSPHAGVGDRAIYQEKTASQSTAFPTSSVLPAGDPIKRISGSFRKSFGLTSLAGNNLAKCRRNTWILRQFSQRFWLELSGEKQPGINLT